MTATGQLRIITPGATIDGAASDVPALDEIRRRLFLTVSEAAELLRVDARTLRRGIEAGDVPAVRIHGTVRIPTDRFLVEVLLLSPVATSAGGGDDDARPPPSD